MIRIHAQFKHNPDTLYYIRPVSFQRQPDIIYIYILGDHFIKRHIPYKIVYRRPLIDFGYRTLPFII